MCTYVCMYAQDDRSYLPSIFMIFDRQMPVGSEMKENDFQVDIQFEYFLLKLFIFYAVAFVSVLQQQMKNKKINNKQSKKI